jgi:hypothetical protein
MKRTKIKYSKDLNSDFEEYVGLGCCPNYLDREWAYIIPRVNTKENWDSFFKKESEAIKYSLFLQFWWDLTEDYSKPTILPSEYCENFVANLEAIGTILKEYLVFDELPPPFFKYLDFIEGEQSYNEIVKKEEIGKNFVRVTYDSSERIEIKEDDVIEQLFVPKKVLPKFKKDLARINSLIVGI